jgi:hypothetical protein
MLPTRAVDGIGSSVDEPRGATRWSGRRHSRVEPSEDGGAVYRSLTDVGTAAWWAQGSRCGLWLRPSSAGTNGQSHISQGAGPP